MPQVLEYFPDVESLATMKDVWKLYFIAKPCNKQYMARLNREDYPRDVGEIDKLYDFLRIYCIRIVEPKSKIVKLEVYKNLLGEPFKLPVEVDTEIAIDT